jgi:hypothetical protein
MRAIRELTRVRKADPLMINTPAGIEGMFRAASRTVRGDSPGLDGFPQAVTSLRRKTIIDAAMAAMT